MYLKAFGVWLLLAVAMVLNGAARDMLYQPALGYDLGHSTSSVLAVAIVWAAAYAFVRATPDARHAEWKRVGLLWLALTVAFEFLAGHYIFGTPWEALLADYNLARGRLWIFVLISTYAAPVYWSSKLYRRADARAWFKA